MASERSTAPIDWEQVCLEHYRKQPSSVLRTLVELARLRNMIDHNEADAERIVRRVGFHWNLSGEAQVLSKKQLEDMKRQDPEGYAVSQLMMELNLLKNPDRVVRKFNIPT